jgi:hypothetical protein
MQQEVELKTVIVSNNNKQTIIQKTISQR